MVAANDNFRVATNRKLTVHEFSARFQLLTAFPECHTAHNQIGACEEVYHADSNAFPFSFSPPSFRKFSLYGFEPRLHEGYGSSCGFAKAASQSAEEGIHERGLTRTAQCVRHNYFSAVPGGGFHSAYRKTASGGEPGPGQRRTRTVPQGNGSPLVLGTTGLGAYGTRED